jgi:hypothetical protein
MMEKECGEPAQKLIERRHCPTRKRLSLGQKNLPGGINKRPAMHCEPTPSVNCDLSGSAYIAVERSGPFDEGE